MANINVSSNKKINVRRMAVIGLLSSISIMLSMTPLGFIPIGPMNATIMHIPVIIGAIVEGPIVGASIGFIFGMSSLIRAINMPTVTNFVLINPLVSVLPRILIGILSYYIFKFVMNITKNIRTSGIVAGALGSLVNTVGVMGMIYILYGERYVEALEKSTESVSIVIATMAVTNGIPEAIIGALVVSSVVAILKKHKK